MKRFIGFLFMGPLWFVRIGSILTMLIVVTLIGSMVYVYATGYGQGVPDEAPFAIMTYSHIEGKAIPLRTYYGDNYVEVDGEPALDGWWSYNGKRYVYHSGVKEFPKAEWGAVTVIRRDVN